jgi:hypothetical protein
MAQAWGKHQICVVPARVAGGRRKSESKRVGPDRGGPFKPSVGLSGAVLEAKRVPTLGRCWLVSFSIVPLVVGGPYLPSVGKCGAVRVVGQFGFPQGTKFPRTPSQSCYWTQEWKIMILQGKNRAND